MPLKIVVLGSGAVASATADRYQSDGHEVVQIGRSPTIGTCIRVADWRWNTVQESLDQLDGLPDRLIVATGQLSTRDHTPEKRLEHLSEDGLNALFDANTLVPAAVVQWLSGRMRRSTALKLVVLTAKVGSISDNRLGGWYSYRISKAAANMLVCSTAIEWHRRFPSAAIAAYHPGTTDSALSAPFQARLPPGQLKSPEEAAGCLVTVLESRIAADTSGRFWHWDGTELPW